MDKPIKILMLNYEFPPLGGGAGNATKYILQEFSKYQNLEVDLVTSAIGGFKISKFSHNTTIHFLNIGKTSENIHYQTNKDLLTYSFKAFLYSKKLIAEKKYDLIHSFFGIPCGVIAKYLGLPYLVCLRGSDVPFYNERFKLLDKLIFQRISKSVWKTAHAVIANSHNLKELALISSPKQPIGVIYNGVDLSEFKNSGFKEIDKTKIKLISTGRLIQRKGYEYLIKAISGLKNVELHLIGDGNLMEYLRLISKQYDSNVILWGQKEHEIISQLLQKSDIFVLPSLNEGMSNSLLEAMACGLPIITTPTGDSKTLIKGNGFVVKQKSVSDLKAKITHYLNDISLIGRHGNQSRSIADSMSWQSVVAKYFEIYQVIIRSN